MTPRSAIARLARSTLIALMFVATTASVASATHFRFGHITWTPTGPLTVEFTVLQGWRRTSCGGSAGDGFVQVGDPGCPVDLLTGDGFNVAAQTGSVISVDVANDWYLARYTATYTYPSATNAGQPWISQLSSCCRISSLQNGHDEPFIVSTSVDLSLADSSPASTLTPIVAMAVNTVNSVTLPIGDVDGDTITCRLATALESAIPIQPGPPNDGSTVPISVSSDCVLTWDTAGTSIGQLWAVQVIIEDSRGGNSPHGTTALDFLIEIVSSVGSAPVCDSPPTPTGTVVIAPGTPYGATVQGSDVDAGDTLTLNSSGLPSGATMTPVLPTSSSSPVSSVFNWTPTTADIGVHPLLFSITDQIGRQGQCGFVIRVTGCGDEVLQSGEQCDGTTNTACPGLCLPPGDPNECRCPTCGDNDVNQTGEVCDGTDDSDCPGLCTSQCVCGTGGGVCGDNNVNPPGEVCDGTSDTACPGACLPAGDPNQCKCPVCGDNDVNQATEECDGTDASACPAGCRADCTCPPTCGDGTVDPGETCDPPNSPAGANGNLCRSDCTVCGDGVPNGGETCDDGNTFECDPVHPQKPFNGDACRNDCTGLNCKDPARIRLREGLDSFKFHARMVPLKSAQGTIPFGSGDLTVRLMAGTTTVFEANLDAGLVVARNAKTFRYRNAAAKREGGIYKLIASRTHDDTYSVTITSHGDLSKAAADMVTHVTIGMQDWTIPGHWVRSTAGWSFRE